jgi:hypothetical protein
MVDLVCLITFVERLEARAEAHQEEETETIKGCMGAMIEEIKAI